MRVVISSDHVDSQGDLITKQGLESAADIINGDRKVRYSVEHMTGLPPLGKIVNAEVIESEGHHYLTVEMLKYDVYEEIEWDKDLVKASCSSNDQPLNEPDFDISSQIKVSLDEANFETRADFEEYIQVLKQSNLDIETESFLRKSIFNDPEIIVKIAEYYFIYKFLRSALDKTVNKISDQLSDKFAEDTIKLYDFIRQSVKELLVKAIPKNRPISYVIKISGNPEVELFASIKEPDLLMKALEFDELTNLKHKITEIKNKIVFEKIQFVLTKTGKWEFNFLLTNKGEAVGRKSSFRKRDRMLELVIDKTTPRLPHDDANGGFG
ncbi:hypothetical protein SAMN05421823_101249 [Catalinimonas alkaloidigena]|uniref:Uncharacterized protein n=1 Tax=Catalinimonas alkaloidigena TaxID=1075417 RepID=A0A1G8X300_9BACT|nr:hypothetical protein [Catalinimonas alkaloidigena]SDJ84831.1 hypothetical protein SAMN05421823_101249 [Catalinimonas alkaloidigena]